MPQTPEAAEPGTEAVTINDTGPNAILQVHAISYSYGAFEALRGISFEAATGEIIGLLGPNGAGKTTAIRVLTTLLRPAAGGFTLNGVPHTRPRDIRRQIGVLPESSGYPRNQTGDEFLRYHARLFGQSSSSASAAAARLLFEVGLAERGSSSIAAYSRGMRQRLGIARALVNDPRVIFLDEPTLGLDPAGQREILRIIEKIAQERGAIVILSTHLLEEVEDVCSRVLILHRGQVVLQGRVADLRREGAASRTGRFEVPPEMHDRALLELTRMPGVVSAKPVGAHRGWLTATFEAGLEPGKDGYGMNTAIQALVTADIPLLSFELEGRHLTDVFLSVTGEV